MLSVSLRPKVIPFKSTYCITYSQSTTKKYIINFNVIIYLLLSQVIQTDQKWSQ